MKEQTGFAIFEPKGGMMLYPVWYSRRTAIEKFLKGGGMTWDECKKIGWTCKKVAINLSK